MDGEDEPIDRAGTDAHLRSCAACRDWSDAAARVTRLARVQPVIDRPAVTEQALVAAFRPHRARLVRPLRVLLGTFGAAQFILGMAQIGGLSGDEHLHSAAAAAGATPGHLWHESAAWNVAVGAGFAWIALRRGRPAGALPMLTVFVALLAMLSTNDILAGRVDVVRLLSHAFVVAGYAVVVALCRPGLDPGRPPADRQGPPWRWHRGLDLDEPTTDQPPTPLRLIPGNAHAGAGRQRAA